MQRQHAHDSRTGLGRALHTNRRILVRETDLPLEAETRCPQQERLRVRLAIGDVFAQDGRLEPIPNAQRPQHEIGYHALRVGDNPGEHTIVFSTLGETMELVHKGHTRDAYVRGALAAAKFLAGKPAGRYSMNDVLGL